MAVERLKRPFTSDQQVRMSIIQSDAVSLRQQETNIDTDVPLRMNRNDFLAIPPPTGRHLWFRVKCLEIRCRH